MSDDKEFHSEEHKDVAHEDVAHENVAHEDAGHEDGRGAPEPHFNGEGQATPGGVQPAHVANSAPGSNDFGVPSGAVPNDYPGGNPAMRHAMGHAEQNDPEVQKQHHAEIMDYLDHARASQDAAGHMASGVTGDEHPAFAGKPKEEEKEEEKKEEEGK